MHQLPSEGMFAQGVTARRPAQQVLLALTVAATLLVAAWYFAGFLLAPAEYERFMRAYESGHENLQVGILLCCIVAAAYSLRSAIARSDRSWAIWGCLFLVASIYAAGEEVSWGQHLLGWGTPELWSQINDQDETNLHNTSFLFDNLPRSVATLFGFLVGLGVPVALKLVPALKRSWSGAFLCSPPTLLPAIFVLLARPMADMVPALSDYGYNPGEAKEAFIYLVLLVYLVDVGQKDRK